MLNRSLSFRAAVRGPRAHPYRKMEAKRRAMEGHAEKLLAVKASAERLDDAVAGGQNLRVVVSASRTLRLDLVEMLADFQAFSRPHRCCLFPCPASVSGLRCAARSCPLRSLPRRLTNLSPSLSRAGTQGRPERSAGVLCHGRPSMPGTIMLAARARAGTVRCWRSTRVHRGAARGVCASLARTNEGGGARSRADAGKSLRRP